MTTGGHITLLTASEAAGTGADITILGTGTHGATGHGIIAVGMTLGITTAGMEDGMTHGITADGTTRGSTLAGTMEDGMIHGTTADGGITDGGDTLYGIIITTITIITTGQTYGEDTGRRPEQTECLRAEQAPEADWAHHRGFPAARHRP